MKNLLKTSTTLLQKHIKVFTVWSQTRLLPNMNSNLQTDRQAERQAERQADRQTDRHGYRQTERQADRETWIQTGRQTTQLVFIDRYNCCSRVFVRHLIGSGRLLVRIYHFLFIKTSKDKSKQVIEEINMYFSTNVSQRSFKRPHSVPVWQVEDVNVLKRFKGFCFSSVQQVHDRQEF